MTPFRSPRGSPRADADGTLAEFLAPILSLVEQETGQIEGWILGIK
jgi:hypothetical protein